MKIISGYIYKPDRILYYIEPTQEQKEAFFAGTAPEELIIHDGKFGTYDSPGYFVINEDGVSKEVLGIEFRPNDDRLSYPDDLASIFLPQGYMVSAIFPDDDHMKGVSLGEGIEELKGHLEAESFRGGMIRVKKNPDLVQCFILHGHCRIFLTAEVIKEENNLSNYIPKSTMEDKLYNAAFRDAITGYYNWNYIWPIISGYGGKGIQDFAFVHFDVKDFKAINVVYGHDCANDVLRRVTERMAEMDWIYFSARCDNDNFSMMIKDMPIEETKQKLEEFFGGISTLKKDPSYNIYYRCGVVPMRSCMLLGDRVADAGKQVQRTGTKAYETEVLFYSDDMYDTLDWSTRIRTYLDAAIRQDEFLVYIQPKYDISNETICGGEALIRWMYQGKTFLNPGRFVPVFETGGLISKLDDIVLKKVCKYLKKWEAQGLKLYPISVNLSRKSIGIPGLASHLTQIVDSYGVDHRYIDFELTESAAYDNQETMISVINELKENGFKISIDDFGTGYSSLSLLSVMPFDTIKIDKSFVDGIASSMTGNNKQHAVMKHIIAMANDLEFVCLAEGAEEKSQVDVLREYGCNVVQGYYYSKPLPAEEYEKKLI